MHGRDDFHVVPFSEIGFGTTWKSSLPLLSRPAALIRVLSLLMSSPTIPWIYSSCFGVVSLRGLGFALELSVSAYC
jgi:hypothetical protein